MNRLGETLHEVAVSPALCHEKKAKRDWSTSVVTAGKTATGLVCGDSEMIIDRVGDEVNGWA